MKRRAWTKEEEEYLGYTVGNQSYEKIAKILNRTVGSVKRKTYAMNLQEKITYPRKEWTEKEIKYIQKNYSIKTVKEIAIHLKRTEASIKSAAKRYDVDSEKIVGYSLKDIAAAFQCNVSVIHRWHNKFGMPVKTEKIGQGTYYCVDGEKFWKWALTKKEIVPINKYKRFSILPEDSKIFSETGWKDVSRNHNKKITSSEKWQIKILREKGYTIKEISEKIGRTEDAVKHILKDIKRNQKNEVDIS